MFPLKKLPRKELRDTFQKCNHVLAITYQIIAHAIIYLTSN